MLQSLLLASCSLKLPVLGQLLVGSSDVSGFTAVVSSADGSIYGRASNNELSIWDGNTTFPISAKPLPTGSYSFTILTTGDEFRETGTFNVTINGRAFDLIDAIPLNTTSPAEGYQSFYQTRRFSVSGATATFDTAQGNPCPPWMATVKYINTTLSAENHELRFLGLIPGDSSGLEEYGDLDYQQAATSYTTSDPTLCLPVGVYRAVENKANSNTTTADFLYLNGNPTKSFGTGYFSVTGGAQRDTFSVVPFPDQAAVHTFLTGALQSVGFTCSVGVPWNFAFNALVDWPEEHYFDLVATSTGALVARGHQWGAGRKVCLDAATNYTLTYVEHYPDDIQSSPNWNYSAFGEFQHIMFVGDEKIVTNLTQTEGSNIYNGQIPSISFRTGTPPTTTTTSPPKVNTTFPPKVSVATSQQIGAGLFVLMAASLL